MILSLQGCTAVGKTTALRYLQEHAPYLHVSWEEHGKVIRGSVGVASGRTSTRTTSRSSAYG